MMAKRASSIKVGIIGGAGLGAGRLLDILTRHPNVRLLTVVSESSPGAPVWTSHPHLRNLPLTFDGFDLKTLKQCDVVFSCKRPGETFPFISDLLESDVRFIDLSADYRLKNAEDYPRWYGLTHPYPKLLRQAVYGLPEWYREKIRTARVVANPGCYTTTAILACAPILAAGYGRRAPVIIDAISGVSGAGRGAKAENLFIAVAENVRAYRVGTHQHTPEIEQELSFLANRGSKGKKRPTAPRGSSSVTALFVPHVGPYKVGIMANCYLRLAEDEPFPTDDELYEILQTTYRDEPFVRVYPADTLPQIEGVWGTNYCDIAAKVDPRTRTIVIVSVTDNLVKGAAGQAVQNMNIMFGIEETTALIGKL